MHPPDTLICAGRFYWVIWMKNAEKVSFLTFQRPKIWKCHFFVVPLHRICK